MEGEADMRELPMKMFWMGEDIETLPRDKLVEIIHDMQRQLEAARSVTSSIMRLNELARLARRNMPAVNTFITDPQT